MKNTDNDIQCEQRDQERRDHILQRPGTFRPLDIREHDIDHEQVSRRHLRDKRKDIVDKIAEAQRKQTARHRISQPESPAADKAHDIVSGRLLHIDVAAARLRYDRHQLRKR